MGLSWTVLCVLSCAGLWGGWGGARTQYFEDPQINFKPFEFDRILRGQYNISQCVTDLLKCWEMMRPDVICDTQWKPKHYDFETICALDKRTCHDGYGYYQTWYRYIVFTGYCQDTWSDYYDKGQWT